MGYFSVLFKYCIDICESSCRTPLTNRLLSFPSIFLARLSPFPDPLSLPAISCSLGVLLRLVGFLASLCLCDQLNRLHLLLHTSLLNYKSVLLPYTYLFNRQKAVKSVFWQKFCFKIFWGTVADVFRYIRNVSGSDKCNSVAVKTVSAYKKDFPFFFFYNIGKRCTHKEASPVTGSSSMRRGPFTRTVFCFMPLRIYFKTASGVSCDLRIRSLAYGTSLKFVKSAWNLKNSVPVFRLRNATFPTHSLFDWLSYLNISSEKVRLR